MYFSIPFSFCPLIQGGRNISLLKLKMTTSGPVPDRDNKRPRARVKLKIYHAISAWADRPAEMTASRPPVEVLRASSYTPPARVSMARFARGLPQLGRAAHGPLRGRVAGSIMMGEAK